MFKRYQVGFVGLGKLGLPCAEAMAQCHDVHGFDTYERSSSKINIVESIQQAVLGMDVIFIAVQTPHDPRYDGSAPTRGLPTADFDYSTVCTVLDEINTWATQDQLVVLISTVLPGTTRRLLMSRLTRAKLLYNPYLIAMGSVAWDMVNPEMVMIGTKSGSETGEASALIDLYRPLMQNQPRYVVGTWEECECIKVFYNTFISAKVGLVNMIQDVAVKLGNVNVDIVTQALANSTMRITGPKYMTAGMGDSGACHPRDNIALRYLAEQLDLGYDMFDTIMHAREIQARNLAEFLAALAREHNLPVCVFGKAYKPRVPYVDGSYSLLIGHFLDELGIQYSYVDPLTGDQSQGPVRAVILLAHDVGVTYGYTGAVPSSEVQLYASILGGSVVVDPWRKYHSLDPEIKVIHYGNTRLG